MINFSLFLPSRCAHVRELLGRQSAELPDVPCERLQNFWFRLTFLYLFNYFSLYSSICRKNESSRYFSIFDQRFLYESMNRTLKKGKEKESSILHQIEQDLFNHIRAPRIWCP